MNFYIVVEGHRTEQKVFASWIPQLNQALTQVSLPGELQQDNFVIVSGFGYPNYLNVVSNAAKDIIANPHYGQLVISVDAEDEDPTLVRQRILDTVHSINSAINPEIVVQDACIETWFLGNRRSIRQFPRTAEGRAWKTFYDVWHQCPELMPAKHIDGLNRAQTSLAYLVESLRDNRSHLRYSKRRPDIVCDGRYLVRLQDRVAATGHLNSFKEFVDIF